MDLVYFVGDYALDMHADEWQCTHAAPEAGTEQNQVQVGKGSIQGNPESDVRRSDLHI